MRKEESLSPLKLGILGVSREYKNSGYGKVILDYLKILFVTENRTGCRYITVDAYSKSVPFYIKNGFIFFTDDDKDEKDEDTRTDVF